MFIPLIYGRHIFIHAQKHLLSLFLHDWPGLPYPLLCHTIRWCAYNTQAQHTFHTFPDMVFALQRDVWPGMISLTPLHHIVSFSFNIISSFLLLVCQLNACKSTSCLTHQYDLISKLLLSQLSVIILEWWWNCCWWQSMEGMSGATAADTNQSGGGVRKHKLSVRTTFDLPPESLTSRWYSLYAGKQLKTIQMIAFSPIVIMLDKSNAEEDSIQSVLSLIDKDVQCVLLRHSHQSLQSVFHEAGVGLKSKIPHLVSDHICLLWMRLGLHVQALVFEPVPVQQTQCQLSFRKNYIWSNYSVAILKRNFTF